MAMTYITDMENNSGLVTIFNVTYLVDGEDKADEILENAYPYSKVVSYEDHDRELHMGYLTEFNGDEEEHIIECFHKAIGKEFDKEKLTIEADEIVFWHITLTSPMFPSVITDQDFWVEKREDILTPEQVAMAYYISNETEDLEWWLIEEGIFPNPDDCENGSYDWDMFLNDTEDWMDAHRR